MSHSDDAEQKDSLDINTFVYYTFYYFLCKYIFYFLYLFLCTDRSFIIYPVGKVYLRHVYWKAHPDRTRRGKNAEAFLNLLPQYS